MKKIGKAILEGLPKLVPDILATAGALTVSYGAYLIIKPLGYITLGVMLIASAVIMSKA